MRIAVVTSFINLERRLFFALKRAEHNRSVCVSLRITSVLPSSQSLNSTAYSLLREKGKMFRTN